MLTAMTTKLNERIFDVMRMSAWMGGRSLCFGLIEERWMMEDEERRGAGLNWAVSYGARASLRRRF